MEEHTFLDGILLLDHTKMLLLDQLLSILVVYLTSTALTTSLEDVAIACPTPFTERTC